MGERREVEGHVSEGGRETAQPEQDLEAGAAVSVTGLSTESLVDVQGVVTVPLVPIKGTSQEDLQCRSSGSIRIVKSLQICND
ncbi:hypothetical protein AAC387_Pa07g3603 [Persea americana]